MDPVIAAGLGLILGAALATASWRYRERARRLAGDVDVHDRVRGLARELQGEAPESTEEALDAVVMGIAELRSDARMNLMHAAISATLSVPEVGIWFGSTLLRGCRATKLSVDSYQAFSSPNLPPLVEMGVDIHYATPALERPGPFRLRRGFRRDVVVLSLHPGMPPRMLDFALEAGARGVVLQGFGAGNLPLDGWAEAISRAADAGVPVVVGSQCRFGRVTLGSYAGSAAARDAGALSAYDMTQEATLVKLMFLLGQGLDRADLAEAWPIALAGELTP